MKFCCSAFKQFCESYNSYSYFPDGFIPAHITIIVGGKDEKRIMVMLYCMFCGTKF